MSYVGDVNLGEIQLKNVMYVPEFKYNLMSVSKLMKDSQCCVIFKNEMCLIQYSVSHKSRACGSMKNGLFYLQKNQCVQKKNEVKCNENNLFFANCNAVNFDECTLWHNRLGHAPMSVLNKIKCLPYSCCFDSNVCLICPMARFTKQPYIRSESHAKQAFEMIHIDTWGPYRVPARGNFRYFLTIVDDYSRATWIHLMKQKSEAYGVIKRFIMFAKTQFDAQVKIIRSDNALEFSDEQCKKLYNELGIVHQTSCVDRPQQNGRVERRHRNVLEMTRALRF